MKLHYLAIFVFLFCFLSSFGPAQPCSYANSNIGYVKKEIEKAISMKDFQLVRFRTYKALNAIEKSKKELEECECKYATENILEGYEHLKQATRTTSLAGSAILLKKALDEIEEGIEALNNHEKHDSAYDDDKLSLNTVKGQKNNGSHAPLDETLLRQKIDSSLENYRNSLENMVNTVNCKEAGDYARRIYDHCEQQLLKPSLSEGKKYYNLKTKEITAEALERLKDCKNK